MLLSSKDHPTSGWQLAYQEGCFSASTHHAKAAYQRAFKHQYRIEDAYQRVGPLTFREAIYPQAVEWEPRLPDAPPAPSSLAKKTRRKSFHATLCSLWSESFLQHPEPLTSEPDARSLLFDAPILLGGCSLPHGSSTHRMKLCQSSFKKIWQSSGQISHIWDFVVFLSNHALFRFLYLPFPRFGKSLRLIPIVRFSSNNH